MNTDTTKIDDRDVTPKDRALANHLKISGEDVFVCNYDDCSFEADGADYLVLTDEEADERCAQYIRDSLWAFNAKFVASHTKNGLSDKVIEAIMEIGGKLCESANAIIEALIEDMDHFIEDAIRADGRGHFLSTYDGEEIELEGGFYAYRTN